MATRNSHGPPKKSSSVGDWRSTLPVLLRSTGSRLVLRLVYYMGLALILSVLLYLLVRDWYYVQVY
jgi:hypothetical protein